MGHRWKGSSALDPNEVEWWLRLSAIYSYLLFEGVLEPPLMQCMEASYLRGCRCPNGGMIPMIPTDEQSIFLCSKGVVVSGRCCDILCRSIFEVFIIFFFSLLATCWKSKRIEREHLKCRKSNMLIWFGTLRKAPGFAGLLILPVLGLGRKVFLCWVELQPFGCLSNCSATATWCRGDDRKFWWMILEEASKMIHLNDLWKGFLKSILIHRNQKLEIRGVKSEGSNICLHILVAALQEAPLRRLCPDLFPSTLHSPWGGSSTSAARQWMLEVGFEWWNQWGLSLCCAGGWKLQPEISPGSVRRWQFYGTYPS